MVVPVNPGRSAGIDARFIAAYDLVTALGSIGYTVDFLTPRGLVEPDELLAAAVRGRPGPQGTTIVRRLPRTIRVVLNDSRAWFRARRARKLKVPSGYSAIIQFHHRFQDVGLRIARTLGIPFVLRVEAMEVREEASWGIRRPLFGRIVEGVGEKRIIEAADLVVTVSSGVEEEIAAAGVHNRHRMIIPNGVDVVRFAPGPRDEELVEGYGLRNRFVVGWVGGFRPFHGLEMVPELATKLRSALPNSVLCMIGDGPNRREIEDACSELSDTVRFVGAVDHEQVPRWIRTFDVGVTLAGPGQFHYSPLKLLETLACGRPAVAPEVGDLPHHFGTTRGCILVPRGDPDAVVDAVARIARSGDEVVALQRAARSAAEDMSWTRQAERLMQVVAELRD